MAKSDSSAVVGCLVMSLTAAAFFFIWSRVSFGAAVVVSVALLVGFAVAAAQASKKREAAAQAARAAEDERDRAARARRYASLCERFGEEVADQIVAGSYWQGATMEMMYESLGPPADEREKVFKSKTKTTHCYKPLDARRYALKVHFEDGIVVGWDEA